MPQVPAAPMTMREPYFTDERMAAFDERLREEAIPLDFRPPPRPLDDPLPQVSVSEEIERSYEAEARAIEDELRLARDVFEGLLADGVALVADIREQGKLCRARIELEVAAANRLRDDVRRQRQAVKPAAEPSMAELNDAGETAESTP